MPAPPLDGGVAGNRDGVEIAEDIFQFNEPLPQILEEPNEGTEIQEDVDEQQ